MIGIDFIEIIISIKIKLQYSTIYFRWKHGKLLFHSIFNQRPKYVEIIQGFSLNLWWPSAAHKISLIFYGKIQFWNFLVLRFKKMCQHEHFSIEACALIYIHRQIPIFVQRIALIFGIGPEKHKLKTLSNGTVQLSSMEDIFWFGHFYGRSVSRSRIY